MYQTYKQHCPGALHSQDGLYDFLNLCLLVCQELDQEEFFLEVVKKVGELAGGESLGGKM